MKTMLFLVLALFSLCPAHTEIVIIYTNNTNGILENCNCPDHAYGALEKRATLINEIRRTDQNIIVLDAGDIFDIQPDTLLHRFVSRAYRSIGYDAWTCGDQDFIDGFEFFGRALLELPMKLVSCNMKFPGNQTVADYTIIEKDNIRIGITGSFNPALFKYISPEVQKKITRVDQDKALQRVLEELQKKSDYQILISHNGFEKDKYLAENFPQFDLIIGGHSQTVLNVPEKIGATLIVQAGESGYRIGVLKLGFKDKIVISAKNDLVLLDNTISDDAGILKIIREFHEKREQRINERKKNE